MNPCSSIPSPASLWKLANSLAGHTYLRAHVGGARKERGSGKNTYINGQVFWRLRRNVGGTNQIADRVIGHQRSCEYHAVCVFSPKQRC